MARVLNIPAKQLSTLAVLRDLGTDGIERLTQAIESRNVLLHIDELQRTLEPVLGDDAKGVGEVLAGLSLLQRTGPQPKEVLDDLTRTLRIRSDELDPAWSESDFEQWASLRDPLLALLGAEPVLAVGKALDLHFAHANILRDIQIVTDMRPVFDSTGEQALAAVISHTLCLRYLDDGRAERLSVALDHDDVTQLVRACERAIRKEKTLKAMLDGLLHTEIAGQNADEKDVDNGIG